MEFRTSTFLNDGVRTRTFDELNYQDKVLIVALETLISLRDNIKAIADIQTLNTNVTQLMEENTQLQESNTQLQEQVNDLQASNIELNEQTTTIQSQLNALRSALLQIDVITDEIID